MSPKTELKTEITEARQKFEQERLTRRSALHKIGMGGGMAFGMFFALDDLTRMVLGRMEQHKATRDIAEIVARDFRNVGIAFANTPCQNCVSIKSSFLSLDASLLGSCMDACPPVCPTCSDPCGSSCTNDYNSRVAQARKDYSNCCSSNNCNCGPISSSSASSSSIAAQ